jgi:hypothetical protein
VADVGWWHKTDMPWSPTDVASGITGHRKAMLNRSKMIPKKTSAGHVDCLVLECSAGVLMFSR